MKVYRIIVETYEVGAPYPILTHVFQGKDEEQTLGFIAAHRKYDQFFRECGMGVFAGRIRCRNVTRVVGWVDAHR